jgi:hypothetical protein
MVARTARSPDFGTPLAFPVSQWRSEWRAWPQKPRCPLQWRGRAGFAPASEYPRSWVFSCLQRLVYRFGPRAARELSSKALRRARSE